MEQHSQGQFHSLFLQLTTTSKQLLCKDAIILLSKFILSYKRLFLCYEVRHSIEWDTMLSLPRDVIAPVCSSKYIQHSLFPWHLQ
jgi:hypothetical protein